MKKSTIVFWSICGSGAALTALARFVGKNRKEKQDSSCDENGNEVGTDIDNIRVDRIDLEKEKVQASFSIVERHTAAAHIIKDSIDDTFEYDVKEGVHKVDFDKIDTNLDMIFDKE